MTQNIITAIRPCIGKPYRVAREVLEGMGLYLFAGNEFCRSFELMNEGIRVDLVFSSGEMDEMIYAWVIRYEGEDSIPTLVR